MSLGEQVSSTERLDELKRVTKIYATYSRVAGIPLALLGAWWLAGMLTVPATVGRVLCLTAPVAWLGAAAVSSALYTRRGVVAFMSRGWHWFLLVVVGLWGVMWMLALSAAHWYRATVSRGALLAGALVVVLVVGLQAYRWTRSGRNPMDAMFAFIFAAQGATDVLGGRRALCVAAALYVVAGIFTHVRFRRLERRMVALQREGMSAADGRCSPPGKIDEVQR